jgi:hypothetical protein
MAKCTFLLFFKKKIKPFFFTATSQPMDTAAHVIEFENQWIYVLRIASSNVPNVGIFGNIDASYSMDATAKLAETSRTVSFISLMRSIFSAIVDTIPTGVELKVGSFADSAIKEFETASLTDAEREEAKSKLRALKTRGSTNLHAAVELGFKNLSSDKRVIFILTDGQPTVRPPLGELAELKKLRDTPEGQNTTLIILAIANSNLDLHLMHQMAVETGGYLIYVNDASMGATCIINAMATICTISETNLKTVVQGNVNVVAPNCMVSKIAEHTQIVNIGILTRGSHRSVVAVAPKTDETPPSMLFSTCTGDIVPSLTEDASWTKFALEEYARSFTTRTLGFAIDNVKAMRVHPAIRSYMSDTAELLSRIQSDHPETSPTIGALLCGIDDQLTKAVQPEYINTWGSGALFAACHAHYNRICINFKDPDVQIYATKESADIRQRAADKFTEPTSIETAQTTRLSPAPTVNWNAYLNQSGGCIIGSTPIYTRDGVVEMKSLVPGTVLRSGAVVADVIKMLRRQPVSVVFLGPKTALTPSHPVRNSDSQWIWPALLNTLTKIHCDAVYNVILEGDVHEIEAASTDATPIRIITLGHNQDNRFAAHPVYGNKTTMLQMAKFHPIVDQQRIVDAF